MHSNWIYDGIRSTGLSGIRSTVEPSGLISMVHSGSISMLEMTGRSQSTLYYRVDIVLLCVKGKVGEYRVGASGSWPAKIAKHT